MILGTNNSLGQQICHHLFRDTKTHLYITEAHVAANEMVPDLQVADIAQSIWIARNAKASHRVGVDGIWFRA
jgi:hypothetical protein